MPGHYVGSTPPFNTMSEHFPSLACSKSGAKRETPPSELPLHSSMGQFQDPVGRVLQSHLGIPFVGRVMTCPLVGFRKSRPFGRNHSLLNDCSRVGDVTSWMALSRVSAGGRPNVFRNCSPIWAGGSPKAIINVSYWRLRSRRTIPSRPITSLIPGRSALRPGGCPRRCQ
jgi:hypothetical protein